MKRCSSSLLPQVRYTRTILVCQARTRTRTRSWGPSTRPPPPQRRRRFIYIANLVIGCNTAFIALSRPQRAMLNLRTPLSASPPSSASSSPRSLAMLRKPPELFWQSKTGVDLPLSRFQAAVCPTREPKLNMTFRARPPERKLPLAELTPR